MKRHQLMNERLKTLELQSAWKNVAAIAVSKFVRRDLFWRQRIVETDDCILRNNDEPDLVNRGRLDHGNIPVAFSFR